jgi:hypothetical protein
MGGNGRGRTATTPWVHLSDDELLDVRICDLKVAIEGSDLEPRIDQLYEELDQAGLAIRPICYLSNEWLSPNGQNAIGIPFYLAHPRLKALEFRMMFEVEGGTRSWCMKLLRHEAGHALDHVYRVHTQEDWKETFGSPRLGYNPYFYAADPHSKAHVRNLPGDYAQCHPDEDFAETFAVWLNPNANWRTRYRGWPAMKKLRYVNRLVRELNGRGARRRKPVLYAEARTLRSTLRTHYRRKAKLYQMGDLVYAVRDLKRIFRVSRASKPGDTAAALIRAHKRRLVESITEWSGEAYNSVAHVVAMLAKQCDEHRLVLRDDPEESLVRFSTYVATLVVNRIHTHTYRLRKR